MLKRLGKGGDIGYMGKLLTDEELEQLNYNLDFKQDLASNDKFIFDGIEYDGFSDLVNLEKSQRAQKITELMKEVKNFETIIE